MAREIQTLGDYAVVLSMMRKALASNKTVKEPFRNERDLAVYRKAVANGKRLLPERYHRMYVDVLDEAVRQAEKSIKRATPSGAERVFAQLETVFTTLAQPIVQLADAEHTDALKAAQAVTTNLYRRFMDDGKVRNASRKTLIWPELDPLAFFGASNSEAYALAPTSEMPVALLSKPVNHAGFLPLWLVDGHEIGGHIVQTAIDGFMTEFDMVARERVKTAFADGKINNPKIKVPVGAASLLSITRFRSVTFQTLVTQLWAKWQGELLADVAGVLNMGPMFVNGMILLFAATSDNGLVNARGKMAPGKSGSTHPVDVVRCLFAIELLERLSFDAAKTHGQALRARLKEACGGQIPDTIRFDDIHGHELYNVKLGDVQAVLSVVAETVATSLLKSIGNRSMTQLMTWGNTDEATANRIASLLPSGSEFDDVLEARHVVCASLLAVERAAQSKDKTLAARIQANGIALLKSLYEEQCLLCALPDYGPTRRTDILKLASLAKLAKSLRR